MRSLRFFGYFLAISVLSLLLGIFLAPPFLSSQTVREKTLPWLSKITQSQIEAERLQLSWFHDQEIKGFKFKTAGIDFSLDSLRLKSPLWKIFIPGKDLESLEIKKPRLKYVLESLPTSSEDSQDQESSLWLSLLVHPIKLDLDEGYLHCQTPQASVILENIHCDASFTSLEAPIQLDFHALSASQERKGSLDFKFNIDSPSNWLASFDIEATLNHFPLELATPFVEPTLAPTLTSISREPLDLNFRFIRKKEQSDCQLHLNCAALKTDMMLGFDNDSLYLKQAAPITLFLKKEEINPFLKLDEPLCLTSDLLVHASLDSFKAPISNLAACTWNLSAQTADLLYKRRSHQGSLKATQIKALCKEGLYQCELSSLKANQLHASIKIGADFEEKDLHFFEVTLPSLSYEDLLPFTDLPSSISGLAFPLNAQFKLERQRETLVGNIKASSKDFQTQADLTIDEKAITLLKSQSHLDRYNLDDVSLTTLDCFLDSLVLPRPFSLEDCQAKACFTCADIALGARHLKNVQLQTGLEKRQLSLDLDSSLAKAKTTLEIRPDLIKCIKPLSLLAHLSPEEAQNWIQPYGFIEPINVDLEVQQASWKPLTPLSDQWLEASAQITPIMIQKSKDSPLIGIPATELQVRCNLNATSAHAMFYSKASSDKKLVPATFKGQAQIRNQSLTKAQIQISELSSDWIDVLAEANGKLSTLLGYNVALDVNIELTGKKPLIQVNAITPTLKAGFSWVQDTRWSLAKPAELHFQLPAKSCGKLLETMVPPNSNFELAQGLDFVTRIDKLETQDKDFDLRKLQGAGQIFLKKAAIKQRDSDRRSELKELKITWKFDGPAGLLEQQLTSQIQASEKYESSSLFGKIESKSSHSNLFNKEKKFSFPTARHKFDLKAEQLSSDWIDFAASFGQSKSMPPLSELLGPVFEIQSHFEIDQKTGPIDLVFSSNFSHLKVNGKLLGDTFNLRSPVEFELHPHPGLSKYFTSQGNSSSISSISTSEPIRITISENNFAFPVNAFDVKKIRIDQLHATMGEIEWKNRGILHFFVNLLKWDQKGDSRTLTIEPLPIDLSMKEGVIKLERSDALIAGLFPVATWGNIDLKAQKLDLTVGVSKEALENALGISDLPEGYLMLVPVHGNLSNPAAEATLATTKIAALIARNSKNLVTQIAPTNPTGLLIGGILSVIVPLPDEKAITPAARYPIPWKFAPKTSSHP